MITQALFRALDKKAIWVVAILLVIALAVPAANLLIPPGSPGHVPNYLVTLFGKYLTYAMLALALDLVWGYCGILSLGHGAFFALGGYAMGMYLMRQIGDRGVYGDPVLPDFMVFLNYSELPWFWQGMDQFWFAMLMVVLVPGLLAFVFGWFAFRSRVTGVYLSIITQAMTYALLLAFFRNDMGFGGNNGLTDFKDILGQPITATTTRASLFAATAIALALSVFICSMIVNSKLGKVMIAVRDAESRARFLGYRVEYVKLFAFVVSAVIAGIAGALYVPQVGIINPGEFAPANSIEVVIWTAVGGRGTIIGPIIGAIIVNMGKSYFTGALPELWLFALGGLFVFVTLFLPKGIVGLIGQWRGYSEWRNRPAPPSDGAPSGEAHASDLAERGENTKTVTRAPQPKPAE
ncbi:branched-chain amino acid ABC transporter permease [Devosia pacifica]|uniref:Branched-chain amino acid ABC transporter permease n=1 Tax=Devosia pacifica TaxID=1335967 RepID=A0A918S0N6_9HYPH|nr:urea ABC transporter permease subunit UrtC [Devosia pacifica]GHA16047.1 branched-chain amino acid ABC transporter permease [Devosia pacifica]